MRRRHVVLCIALSLSLSHVRQEHIVPSQQRTVLSEPQKDQPSSGSTNMPIMNIYFGNRVSPTTDSDFLNPKQYNTLQLFPAVSSR